jgi:hypothetical protein
MPPVLWVIWFGLGWFPQALGAVSGAQLIHGLTLAWLVMAV